MREISFRTMLVVSVSFLIGVCIAFVEADIIYGVIWMVGFPILAFFLVRFLEKKNDKGNKIQDDVVDRDLIANIDDHYELIRVKNRRLED